MNAAVIPRDNIGRHFPVTYTNSASVAKMPSARGALVFKSEISNSQCIMDKTFDYIGTAISIF